MEATLAFTCDDLPLAQSWLADQLAEWGVGTPHASRWLTRGAELLGADRLGHVVLCFDREERVVSLDVYCGSQRLFGMDDLV